jgi:hypothetical protein
MPSINVPRGILREAEQRKKSQPDKRIFDLCVDVAIEKKINQDPLIRVYKNMAKGKAIDGKQPPKGWGIGL